MKLTLIKPKALAFIASSLQLTLSNANPLEGLQDAHINGGDSSFLEDLQEIKKIGSNTALIPEASTADEDIELVDGKSGDTDFPFASFKPIATVGEFDPNTGQPLTGWPDGNAAWLADDDTVRVAYQSESYAFYSTETYPWKMKNGATFTGSHVHTIDYNREGFADFLNNETAASEIFEASGHLFHTVYNAIGNEVKPLSTAGNGEYWGKQMLPDGSRAPYSENFQLQGADYYFQSFCGSHFEPAHKYGLPQFMGGSGCGFEDDIWLCGEEWNIDFDNGVYANGVRSTETMGLASLAVDIANGTAYTVPALGQTGYEKLLPINPGCSGYVIIVCSGYNFDRPIDTAPLRIYIGKKGVDADGNVLNLFDPNISERDRFLSRNGLLYGKIYGMALSNTDHATLNITPDATTQQLDDYLQDETAPNNFSVRYYPTSYKWAGWGTENAVAVIDTDVDLWTNPNEQPNVDYTYLCSDDKVEHSAVDPDMTKSRYIQNMTEEGALLGIDFTNLSAELTATNDLPEYLSAEVTRIVAAVDGAFEVAVANKGIAHTGELNPDGSLTAAMHVEDQVTKMVAPDGLQWVKTADADVLIVDEDSGNDYGERKYAVVIDPETLTLKVDKTGYFLALSGGSFSPRAEAAVAAYPGTFQSARTSEFSGTWNVTGLITKKEDGSFYTKEELAGPGVETVAQSVPLDESTLIGVIQHRTESGGPLVNFRADRGGQIFQFRMCLPTPGMEFAHLSSVDSENENFSSDAAATQFIGSVTALIPEASTADDSAELIDGESADTDFPFANFKTLATVGEIDPKTGLPLTGWPDGNAAWLADEETVRIGYQSESYAFYSTETYPWEMTSGATFTGSHIHTIDYDRKKFADFMQNDIPASDMFKASNHLFDTVYNVLGNEVQPLATAENGEYWGKQMLPDGSHAPYSEGFSLIGSDYYFQSLCGAHFEKAEKYGEELGFADDVWLCGEEWNIDFDNGVYANGVRSIDTMGLASIVVDVANRTAYTVPALGQSGYEKLLPVNPGSPDYTVIICSGYNFDRPIDTAPLRIYIGKKGVDAGGNVVDQNDENTPERDKFLARNGLLFGKIYGMALSNSDHANLNVTPDATTQQLDDYLQNLTAPDTFAVRFYPTSYQWAGWGTENAVSIGNTDADLWTNPNEQPNTEYTYFCSDDKVEHSAADPDITKFRYIQNMTEEGALLGVEFSALLAELTADENLPEYISADCRRIVAAVDGEFAVEVGDKGISHTGELNPDGTLTAAMHVEEQVTKMVAPDGLQWIRTADADVLIVDEDSGNDYGERKYAIVLNPNTLELAEEGKGYFLAMSGGEFSPRATAAVAAYPGTFQSARTSEFSGSWNLTGLITKKEDGSFYSLEELYGPGEQAVNETVNLSDHTIMGVVQHRTESGGPLVNFRADRGGQVFAFHMDIPTLGGTVTYDFGSGGIPANSTQTTQTLRAGEELAYPEVEAKDGLIFTGWDTQVDQISGDTTIRAQYADASQFFTLEDIVEIFPNPSITRLGNGNMVIEIDMQKSDALETFADFDLTNETVSVNDDGNLEIEFTPTERAQFYRLAGVKTE